MSITQKRSVKLTSSCEVIIQPYCLQSAGWSALFFAAKNGKTSTVNLLLEHEADMWLKAKVLTLCRNL